MNKQIALKRIRRHVDALERAELGTPAHTSALAELERVVQQLADAHTTYTTKHREPGAREPRPGQRLGTILEDVHDTLSKRTFRAPVLRAGERVVIEEAHADWIRVRKLNSNHIVNLMARKVREIPQ